MKLSLLCIETKEKIIFTDNLTKAILESTLSKEMKDKLLSYVSLNDFVHEVFRIENSVLHYSVVIL